MLALTPSFQRSSTVPISMRRIGNLPDAQQAERFCDYLFTRSIHATWEPAESAGTGAAGEPNAAGAQAAADGYDIWIRDEADLDPARETLREFQQSPRDPKYDVREEASRLREQQAAENARRRKHQRDAGKSMGSPVPRGGGLTGGMPSGLGRQQATPVTMAVIALSVLASFVTNFGNLRVPVQPSGAEDLPMEVRLFLGLSFVDYYDYAVEQDSFASVRQGELWRLITPMFLHGSIFHLLFNMLWIYSLGSAIERVHGSLFFVTLLLGTEIAGMLLQVLLPDWLPPALRGSPFAIGASGAVYGLFGYLWIRPQVDPGYPIRMPPMNVAIMLGWLVLCMTPVIPGIANGAHLGGLLAGTVVASAWGKSV